MFEIKAFPCLNYNPYDKYMSFCNSCIRFREFMETNLILPLINIKYIFQDMTEDIFK